MAFQKICHNFNVTVWNKLFVDDFGVWTHIESVRCVNISDGVLLAVDVLRVIFDHQSHRRAAIVWRTKTVLTLQYGSFYVNWLAHFFRHAFDRRWLWLGRLQNALLVVGCIEVVHLEPIAHTCGRSSIAENGLRRKWRSISCRRSRMQFDRR